MWCNPRWVLACGILFHQCEAASIRVEDICCDEASEPSSENRKVDHGVAVRSRIRLMQLGCAEGGVDSALSLSARFMSFRIKRRRNEKKERLRAPAQKEDEARERQPSKRFTSRVLYIHPVITHRFCLQPAFVRPLHGSNAVHYEVVGKAGLNFGGRLAIATGGSPGRRLELCHTKPGTCTRLRSSFGGVRSGSRFFQCTAIQLAVA